MKRIVVRFILAGLTITGLSAFQNCTKSQPLDSALLSSNATSTSTTTPAKNPPDSLSFQSITNAIQNGHLNWTASEYLNQPIGALGLKMSPTSAIRNATRLNVKPKIYPTPPATVDWRNVNGASFVTPVKNQLQCGSCWAFASTAALESYLLINQNSSMNLSEQFLISNSGAGNCEGGDPGLAANFIQLTGVPPTTFEPYLATDGGSPLSGWQNAVEQAGNVGISYNTTAANLEYLIATNGPVVVSLEIFADFYSYSSGVYEYSGVGADTGGHAVLVVGYDDANQFFIVKNSWGPAWGENGYFRIGFSQMTNQVAFAPWAIVYELPTTPTPTPTPTATPSPQTCPIANGTGIMSAGGSCMVTSCNTGYIMSGNSCTAVIPSTPLPTGENNFLNGLYTGLYNQQPDTVGYLFWKMEIQVNGISPAQIAADFIASSQFQAKQGGLSNTAFMTCLYNAFFDHAPDAAGLQFWVAQLGNGLARSVAVQDFLTAAEFNTNAIANGFSSGGTFSPMTIPNF